MNSLEFKELLFSEEIDSDSEYETMEFENGRLSRRNELGYFLIELAK